MPYISEDPEGYLATTAQLLRLEDMNEAADVLRQATPRVEETGYDNWNGGTRIWTIFLSVDPALYTRLASNREALQEQIDKRLKQVIEQYTEDWFAVKIVPEVRKQPDWRQHQGNISRIARQDIIDGLRLGGVHWAGRSGEVEFLERLYDLNALPSTDTRFTNAAGDIWQHRVNNPEDWRDDWVFTDSRFALLDGPPDAFIRFLCTTVHPVVRPDRNEAMKLVTQYNEVLRREGWVLVEEEPLAGRPRFVGKKIKDSSGRAVSRARTVALALDAGWMQREIERLEHAVERDPALAIGTAKELVETCCKTILSHRGVEVSRSDDLPKLTKALAKELKLVPEAISEAAKGAETIRHILRHLSALTQNLAELRGLYGSGHGRDGKYRGLEPRHARLAVGAAVAFIDFVTETYQERHVAKEPSKEAGAAE